MKKNKEKETTQKKNKKCRLWLAIFSFITIIANIFAIYNILLLGPIEEVIRYLIIGIFVLLDIIIIFKVRTKRRHKEKKIKLLITVLIFYLIIITFS